jgi:menaquinone-dependent protoporphyrinogen oxidase
MRVLVTWGSKRGGTAGIARILADQLRVHGVDALAAGVDEVRSIRGFDSVIIGGAIYANRWPASLRWFVSRHARELRRVPVWFFSSGPLDDSADRSAIPPTRQVAVLGERIGVRGHETFGGRLESGAKGFPASAMARKKAGDWRNEDRVRAWADRVAAELPTAAPGMAIDHPAYAPRRLLFYGLAGWVASAGIRAGLSMVLGPATTSIVHAVAGGIVFGLLARSYFAARGARDALPTAGAWAIVVVSLDLILGWLARPDIATLAGGAGTWVFASLVFLVTWAVGEIDSMIPARGRGATRQ